MVETDINDGCKTDRVRMYWVYETIKINGLVAEYSRCPRCGRCPDAYGFVKLPSCPNCGLEMDK